MESPYYEMIHDFEEENRLFQSGYVKGYHDAVMKYPAIVRCKDCTQNNQCSIQFKFADADNPGEWFCAYGERQEGR